MTDQQTTPVILELAPLPREQIGPFLLLGLDKTADKEDVGEKWAERLKLARRRQIKIPLEDINWAREVFSEAEKRIRADAASLNLDTADGVLRDLSEHFGGSAAADRRCRLIDEEIDLRDYAPAVELPTAAEIMSGIVVPDVPEETPAARSILEEFLRQPLDPWNLPIDW
jgi:hypothetical protein